MNTERVVGRLRAGYVIHQGAGAGRDVIKGPAEIGLNKKTAAMYLHMFENRQEIQQAFGLPVDRTIPSMEDEMGQRAAAGRQIAGQNAGLAGPAFDEAVTTEVNRQLAPLNERIATLEAAANVQRPRTTRGKGGRAKSGH
jgi:hypothetical protein